MSITISVFYCRHSLVGSSKTVFISRSNWINKNRQAIESTNLKN